MDQTKLQSVIDYTEYYYSNHFGLMITGSHVDNNENAYSDIDVLIFMKDRNEVYNETLDYNSIKIQAILIPIQKIDDIIWMDYKLCKGSFINMISKGKIIFDSNNTLKNLKAFCSNLERNGGFPLKEEDIFLIRVKITNQLYDIMGSTSNDELFFSISDMLDLLTELMLKEAGRWCGNGKYRGRQLKSSFPNIHNAINQSLSSFYHDNDKAPLVNLVKDILDGYGGTLSNYAKNSFYTIVNSDYLIIKIESNSSNNRIEKTIRFLKEILKQIKDKPLSYYFLSGIPVERDQVSDQILLVIHIDKSYINNYLIDHLNLLFEKRKGVSPISFPYQYDPKYKFSSEQVYNYYLNFFNSISKYTLKVTNIFDQNFKIKTGIKLFNIIKIKWFNNDITKFQEFLGYLVENWTIYSCAGNLKNASDMMKKKNLILKRFDKMFEQQKKFIAQEYESLDKELFELVPPPPDAKLLNDIPIYKVFLYSDFDKSEYYLKKMSLYKEVMFRILSILLIETRHIVYLPYCLQKIK